jgi:hypothetical protein
METCPSAQAPVVQVVQSPTGQAGHSSCGVSAGMHGQHASMHASPQMGSLMPSIEIIPVKHTTPLAVVGVAS